MVNDPWCGFCTLGVVSFGGWCCADGVWATENCARLGNNQLAPVRWAPTFLPSSAPGASPFPVGRGQSAPYPPGHAPFEEGWVVGLMECSFSADAGLVSFGRSRMGHVGRERQSANSSHLCCLRRKAIATAPAPRVIIVAGSGTTSNEYHSISSVWFAMFQFTTSFRVKVLILSWPEKFPDWAAMMIGSL